MCHQAPVGQELILWRWITHCSQARWGFFGRNATTAGRPSARIGSFQAAYTRSRIHGFNQLVAGQASLVTAAGGPTGRFCTRSMPFSRCFPPWLPRRGGAAPQSAPRFRGAASAFSQNHLPGGSPGLLQQPALPQQAFRTTGTDTARADARDIAVTRPCPFAQKPGGGKLGHVGDGQIIATRGKPPSTLRLPGRFKPAPTPWRGFGTQLRCGQITWTIDLRRHIRLDTGVSSHAPGRQPGCRRRDRHRAPTSPILAYPHPIIIFCSQLGGSRSRASFNWHAPLSLPGISIIGIARPLAHTVLSTTSGALDGTGRFRRASAFGSHEPGGLPGTRSILAFGGGFPDCSFRRPQYDLFSLRAGAPLKGIETGGKYWPSRNLIP